jgi:hypothetical protein
MYLLESASILTGPGFYINLPVGAVAAVAIILLRIPQQTVKPPAMTVLRQLHHKLDLIGFVLFAPAVLQLLLALQYGGNQFPWNSSRVIGLFCGSAATFVVWFLWNWRKGDGALLPPAMVGRTAVWTSGVYQGLLMSANYGGIYFLPVYFQAINNAGPMSSGVYLLPTILPQLVTAASSGFISMPHISIPTDKLLVADNNSIKNWLRNAFGVLLHSPLIDGQRLILVASTWQFNWRVGWIPNRRRYWLRCRIASGSYISKDA